MWVGLIIVGALLVVAFLWQRIRNPSPAVPPLAMPDDDPRMLTATAKARATFDAFRSLASANLKGANVRTAFVTSSGVTEHLWAEVLAIDGDEFEVRLITPPVTHTGKVDRLRRIKVGEIDDWQVEDSTGMMRGGFTMRVMFKAAEEQWGSLPPELEQLRARYLDDDGGQNV